MKNPQQPQLLPPKILENLKGYKGYRTTTCLECGYIGMMGVKLKKRRVFQSIFWSILTAVVFALCGVYGLSATPAIFGLTYGIFSEATIKIFLFCPNCEKIIS